eukprot:7369221-Ditylum_brightwellii.AAC.1
MASSSVLASGLLGPIAIPAAVGGALSFLALWIKEKNNESMWKERTKILNDELQKWQEGQKRCAIL